MTEDLRSLIRTSWNSRHVPPAAINAEVTGERQGLRQRLFQRILRALETGGGGTLDRERIRTILEESPETEELSDEAMSRIEQELVDEVEGLGPVARLLRDPTVSDILINGPQEVWIDRFGKLERTSVRFEDETHLRRILRRMVATQGRRLDEAVPWVDLRLPDGSRLNAVLSPVSLRGSVVSIRRARETVYRLDELVAFGTLNAEMAALLTAAVRERRNLVIAGGAGAGKTTLLNVLSRAIPAGQRIVTIEETAELRLDHPHVVSLEARPSNAEGSGGVDLRTLVRNALRMRADRIIVGEVRGAEAFEMLQAMHVGHDGSLTTIHANSPRDALRRLESLVMTGGELAAATLREVIATTIHLIAQMTRFPDGSRRITSLSEITFGGSEVRARDLFVYDASCGQFESTAAYGPFLATLEPSA
ncbi:MAG: CpaF family protein [Acidobacteria bacterium]|nr:CpaF family protein [Acidobacteriota bacterium]MBV9071861.1 CpaF family protein [Acidobacteriota bacterium]MBV9188799.1 CpaF family protein [Acidobacteriota bacterium]